VFTVRATISSKCVHVLPGIVSRYHSSIARPFSRTGVDAEVSSRRAIDGAIHDGMWSINVSGLGSGSVDVRRREVNRFVEISKAIKPSEMAMGEELTAVHHSNEAHNAHIIFRCIPCIRPVVEYFSDIQLGTGTKHFRKLYTGFPSAVQGKLSLNMAPSFGLLTQ